MPGNRSRIYAWIALLTAVVSCKPRHPSVIRYQTLAPIRDTFDPYNLLFESDVFMTMHLDSTLVEIDQSGKLSSSIVRTWKRSIDGTLWEFELFPEAKWS